MRLLFLDVDGVLNSRNWITSPRRPTPEQSEVQFPGGRHVRHALRSLDPLAVAAVNELVTRSEARVVISSSWRTMWPLDKLAYFLRFHGFQHHLLGATPDLVETMADTTLFGGGGRGNEIKTWLGLLPWVAPESYLVLDDDHVDVPEGRLYRTSNTEGFTAGDVAAAQARFR